LQSLSCFALNGLIEFLFSQSPWCTLCPSFSWTPRGLFSFFFLLPELLHFSILRYSVADSWRSCRSVSRKVAFLLWEHDSIGLSFWLHHSGLCFFFTRFVLRLSISGHSSSACSPYWELDEICPPYHCQLDGKVDCLVFVCLSLHVIALPFMFSALLPRLLLWRSVRLILRFVLCPLSSHLSFVLSRQDPVRYCLQNSWLQRSVGALCSIIDLFIVFLLIVDPQYPRFWWLWYVFSFFLNFQITTIPFPLILQGKPKLKSRKRTDDIVQLALPLHPATVGLYSLLLLFCFRFQFCLCVFLGSWIAQVLWLLVSNQKGEWAISLWLYSSSLELC
jgi:hypothetical protein